MKKIFTRATALLMIAVILSCTVLLPPVAAQAEITTDSTSNGLAVSGAASADPPYDFVLPNEDYTGEERIVEMLSRREENSKHFLLPDGTVSAVVYAEPIHRQGTSGEWLDFENSVSLKRAGQTEVYASADARLMFAKQATAGAPALTLSESGYRISLSFIEPLGTDRASSSGTTAIVAHNAPSAKEYFTTLEEAVQSISGSTTVKYGDAYQKTDVEYVVRGSSVKENIIIKERLPAYSYSFLLSLEGLVATLEKNGAITLTDSKSGATRYVLPNPYMYDAKKRISAAVTYSLQKVKDGVYLLTVTADTEWINAAERAFPVTVDPTITANSGFEDTFVNAADPNTNYGGWTGVWLDATYTGLVKFPLPEMPMGATITEALLRLSYGYYLGVTGSRTVGLYQMNAAWSESTVTYNSLYNAHGAGLGSAASPMVTVSVPTTSSTILVNVLSAVQAWYGGATNNGLMLKNGTENLSAEPGVGYLSTIFNSSEAVTDTPMYIRLRYIDPRVNNGVYRIKNVQTGKYLTVQNGGTTAGTSLIQSENTPTVNGEPNRAQLFKITYFLTTTPIGQGMNFYSIRAMTNSALALDAPYTTSGGATLQEKSPSDTDNLPLTQSWVITPSGNSFLLKNGPETYESYLTASTGTGIITASTITASSQWVLEPYNGEALGGINFTSTPRELLLGETASYAATMYSSAIGTNGPVLYSVCDPYGGPTTKATINANGELTALETGTISVRWTYENAPWAWFVLVDIGFEDEIIYTFRHMGSNQLMLESTSATAVTAAAYNSGTASSMWQTEYHSSGYYKIKNHVTGHYLSASNTGSFGLHVGADAGDSSLFKFERVGDGYRIKSKWQHENAASSPRYVTVSGSGITQSYASSSTEHLWAIKPLKIKLNIKYDAAFKERRGETTYRQYLIDLFFKEMDGVSIESMLKDKFGIKLSVYIPDTGYETCHHECSLRNNKNAVCYNTGGESCVAAPPPGQPLNDVAKAEATEDCVDELHHKNLNRMLLALPAVPLVSSQHIDMLFTGHETCALLDSECMPYAVLGWASMGNNTAVIGSQSQDPLIVRGIACHELLHLLGAPDHAGDCVLGSGMFNATVINPLFLCNNCINSIQQNKLKLYHHQ